RGSGGMLFPIKGEGASMEPIKGRIIETPEDAEATERWRSPHSGFLAYVPPDSIGKGEALARTGSGRFTACTACHGADLAGMGPVPGIAGRSPSYLVRQLFDMRAGNRRGLWGPLMAPVVAALTDEDMVNLAAYAASLPP